jgi:SAM-dependent methyltransferase
MFEKYASSYIHPGHRVLEIGPDGVPSTYRRHTSVDVAMWHTLDFPGTTGLTYELTDGYCFPVPTDYYDVVLSGQVIEHIPRPWRWMPELTRVTRPGGVVVTIAPVSWPFHEAPVDCWRAYPDGLRALYEDAGLEVLVAEWGSLELEQIVQRLPPRPRRLRRAEYWQPFSLLILRLHESRIRLPFEGAFDTIAIGRKP